MRRRRGPWARALPVLTLLALCACGGTARTAAAPDAAILTPTPTPTQVFPPDLALHQWTIDGAPDYYTATGPAHKVFAQGQPCGRSCQPIRFTVEEHVPDAAYAQVVAVVSEARHDGLNVTLESRQFMWKPASVYYPPGVTQADVQRVGIFSDNDPPPSSVSAESERLLLGWNTVLATGGEHERFTMVQGHLHLAAMTGDPTAVRTAIRQIVAITQGVRWTEALDSGLWTGTGIDAFTPGDVAALKAMSGCGDDAAPVVASTPM